MFYAYGLTFGAGTRRWSPDWLADWSGPVGRPTCNNLVWKSACCIAVVVWQV